MPQELRLFPEDEDTSVVFGPKTKAEAHTEVDAKVAEASAGLDADLEENEADSCDEESKENYRSWVAGYKLLMDEEAVQLHKIIQES